MNPHNWMPTTKKQSVLVYALNVLLLLNLTVIVVMLSDTTEPTRDRASAPRPVVNDAMDRPEVFLPQPGSPEEPVVTSLATEPTPLMQVSAEPFVLSSPPAEEVEAAPSPTAQPEVVVDPPVTFFGIGIE